MRPIPPAAERCEAMSAKTGERCEYRHADGRLCWIHQRNGAVIPDAWTTTGLPIFHLSKAAS